MNFIDPGSGLPLKRVQEESYFFRMAKYGDWLIQHIETHPESIQPEQFRNNILTRLKTDPLKDLSISRTTFSWGIKVPEGFDPKHVMYVWFDALTNYGSGVQFLDPTSELNKYWPAEVHLIGKDIVWFHSVIWPCMLKSAGLALPRQVYCHGFVNAADGRKMSKSYNNTIDPMEVPRIRPISSSPPLSFSLSLSLFHFHTQVLDTYPSDTVRYYSIMAASYGSDLNFSTQAMEVMHNSELADILGNLVHRGLSLCLKYCDGMIPDTTHDSAFPLPFNFEELDREIRSDLLTSSLNLATFKAMEAVRATNKFLTTTEPWKMKGPDDGIRRMAIVRTTLEAIYLCAHYLTPSIPIAAGEIFHRLGTSPRPTNLLRGDFYNLIPGTRVHLGNILFTKIEDGVPAGAAGAAGGGAGGKVGGEEKKNNKTKESKKGVAPAPAAASSTATASSTKDQSKKESSEKKEKKPKSAAPQQSEETEIEQHDFTKIELRVGQIVKVWHHETAERFVSCLLPSLISPS
jgi:methionyl-tRNA synthetase